ncbi:MAG: Fic family protein [Candidatus Aenigmarchaeota archaeon]|nr:Fic family protein [Candidatus Aenigmarchaeota archaeon]
MDHVIQRIDETVRRMNTHPDYNRCVREEQYRDHLTDAASHSIRIEENGEGMRYSAKEQAQLYKNLCNAWEHLSRNSITLGTMAVLGKMIEPDKNISNFRTTEVLIGTVAPSPAAKVPYHVKGLVDYLDSTTDHPVLRATEAHIQTARIHPWVDGNGRGARLMQDFCLYQHGYPPGVISYDERKTYQENLRGALAARESRSSSITSPNTAERVLHDFIFKQILASATTIEEQLKQHRMYMVELSGIREQGVLQSIARDIRNYRRSSGHELRVSVERGKKKKNGILYVDGNIDLDQLEEMLSSDIKKYHGSFRAQVKRTC